MVEDQPVDPERLECLRKASPEEKTDIVLALIEEHGKLELPGIKMYPGWSNPTYTMPTTNPMSLIARIGGGSAFYVGRHKQFSAPSNGVLYLGANDNMYGDNSGSLVVRIILNRR